MVEEKKVIYSKIAGISQPERQEAARLCRKNEVLLLEREPSNAFDRNAVKVVTKDGKLLGYLNRGLASEIAPLMDSGKRFSCLIKDVTGFGKQSTGINIVVSELA